MKKNGILNSEISKVLSDLGHTDTIIIADCGLPVPKEVKKIDLALKLGTPSFEEVFKVVLEDMQVEKVVLASEIIENNSNQNKMVKEVLDKNTEIDYVSHEDFKKMSSAAAVIIRTGEATPYSNIILQSGVIF